MKIQILIFCRKKKKRDGNTTDLISEHFQRSLWLYDPRVKNHSLRLVVLKAPRSPQNFFQGAHEVKATFKIILRHYLSF